jgi:type IV secretory pathway VirB2 component (pilin)
MINWKLSQIKRFLFYTLLCVAPISFVVLFLDSSIAFATAPTSEGSVFDSSSCNIINLVLGTPGKAFAAFAVISVGIGFFSGKVSWGLLIGVVGGITVMFAAPSIVQLLSGRPMFACESGVIYVNKCEGGTCFSCPRGFSGSECDRCAIGFSAEKNCEECDEGYQGSNCDICDDTGGYVGFDGTCSKGCKVENISGVANTAVSPGESFLTCDQEGFSGSVRYSCINELFTQNAADSCSCKGNRTGNNCTTCLANFTNVDGACREDCNVQIAGVEINSVLYGDGLLGCTKTGYANSINYSCANGIANTNGNSCVCDEGYAGPIANCAASCDEANGYEMLNGECKKGCAISEVGITLSFVNRSLDPAPITCDVPNYDDTIEINYTCDPDNVNIQDQFSIDGSCQCLIGYDINQNCSTCLTGLDPITNCSTCLANYDPNQGCSTCLSGYDESQNCTTCLNGFDPQQNCEYCLAGYDPTNNCSTCLAGYDSATSCSTCLTGYDSATSCSTCLAGYDPANNCSTCIAGYDSATSCSTCLSGYDSTNNCSTCLAGYDPANNCSTCIVGYDSATSCSTCLSGYDPANNCSTCLSGYDPANNCSTCIAGYDPTNNCSTCLAGYDSSTNCTSCLVGYAGSNCQICDVANNYTDYDNNRTCELQCQITGQEGIVDGTFVDSGSTTFNCNDAQATGGAITYTCNNGRLGTVTNNCIIPIIPACSGGDVVDTTSIPGDIVHVFTSTGSSALTCNKSVTAQVLIVAGGGGGMKHNDGGGGGGGGGVIEQSYSLSNGLHTVIVGVGGARNNAANSNGGNSSLDSLTAFGGGQGNNSGGSGGGGYRHSQNGASGISGQGHSGGNYHSGGLGGGGASGAGGGGGAGGPGGNASGNGRPVYVGLGGVGYQSSITGSSSYYVGGGGVGGSSVHQGSCNTTAATTGGGLGGGGNIGKNGANGFGGGGGGSCSTGNSGSGGSGIVIVRYTNP